jgi:hypothetical protein
MENRTEHTPEEEPQGWGAYALPPSYSAEQGQSNSAQQGWCFRVREMLPDLLENDGAVQPDMSAALHAHLAVCPACGREFEALSRVIALVEALGPVEMPADLSEAIMQRIRLQQNPQAPEASSLPFVSSASFATASAAETDRRAEARQTETAQAPSTARIGRSEKADSISKAIESLVGRQAVQVDLPAEVWRRLVLATLLAAIAVVWLLTPAGRADLGINVQEFGDWLGQVAQVLCSIPVLGALFGALVESLGTIANMLESSFRPMGAGVVDGCLLDGLLALVICRHVARRRVSRR